MESKFDLIERYLMHDMSVKEQLQFEELLINDPELQKEFALRKEINHAIQEEDIINLRSELGEMMNKSYSSKTRKIYFYSAVAAIITLVITIGSIYFSPFYSKSNHDLFQSYYHSYPAVTSYRSQVDQNDPEKVLHDALKHYEDGEFALASELFRDAIKKDSLNYMSQFYLAICEMESNNFKEAKNLLIKLTKNNKHIFWEQAHWYLALVYLKQNENDHAKTILNLIVSEDMAQKSDAETILKLMD